MIDDDEEILHFLLGLELEAKNEIGSCSWRELFMYGGTLYVRNVLSPPRASKFDDGVYCKNPINLY